VKIKVSIILVFFSVVTMIAQEKYITKSGQLSFEASVPSFEEVKADNSNVSAILKDNGDFASLTLMKGFRFKVALMEEHFNENYVESSEFPKTTFRGKIKDFDMAALGDQEKNYVIEGVINMHGTDKAVEVPVTMKKTDEGIHLTTNFILKPGDFNIEIPSIVKSKIADEVNVSAKYLLKN